MIGSIVPIFGVIIGAAVIVGFICTISISTWAFDGSEYSWNLNKDGSLKDKVVKARALTTRILKWCVGVSIVATTLMIIVPSQKTAWTMVGAYAAQKVAEDPRAAEVGAKVMTVINQQLDSLIEAGAKNANKVGKDTK